MQYFLTRFVYYSFEEAKAKAVVALAAEGFGVLTEINVQATMQAKLDIEFHPYHIFGACQPQLAHQALQTEPHIAALMPCNVFVQQHPDGRVEVSVMNPATLVAITGNPALQPVEDEVRDRIARVLAAL